MKPVVITDASHRNHSHTAMVGTKTWRNFTWAFDFL